MKFTDFAKSAHDVQTAINLQTVRTDIALVCEDLLLIPPDEIIPEKRYVKYDDLVLFVGNDNRFQWVNVCPYCGELTVSERVTDLFELGELLKYPFEPTNAHYCEDTKTLRRYYLRCFFSGKLDLSHKYHGY